MKKPKRLSKKQLQEDREAFAALKAIVGYNPSNPEFSLENVTDSFDTTYAKQTLEVQKAAEAEAAQDDAEDSEYHSHDMILGAKDQVKAQFGVNSNEYQSMGMKKKSEYRKPSKRKKSDDSESNE